MTGTANRLPSKAMLALARIILAALALPFKSKGRLEAENAILRQQIIVLRRQVHGRVKLTVARRDVHAHLAVADVQTSCAVSSVCTSKLPSSLRATQ